MAVTTAKTEAAGATGTDLSACVAGKGRAAAGRGLVSAAVIVPVYRDAGGVLRLVLIRRAPGGVHGGQLAFPGGKQEPGDASLLATALREAEEEIGLPPHAIRVIRELPVVETRATCFRIHPFLAAVVPPETWCIDRREVAEIVEAPLPDLLDPASRGRAPRSELGGSGDHSAPFIAIRNHRLWGASLRIVAPLLPRLDTML